jgi:cytochrome oxidase assembly protein ShyY1
VDLVGLVATGTDDLRFPVRGGGRGLICGGQGLIYGGDVLRLALRPKWLSLLALVLLVATAFVVLGNWQLARSRENADPVLKIEPAEPIADVLAPQQGLPPKAATVPVIASGRLAADQALVVGQRRDHGAAVRWLIAPLEVSLPDGVARLAVVLGSVPDDGRPVPELAPAPVRMEAMMQPPEQPLPVNPDGSLASVSTADLINRWGPPLYSGFVFADPQTAAHFGVKPIDPPKPQADKGFAILNLSYAIEWWVFASLAVFIWWRLLRDAHRASAPSPAHSATRTSASEDPSPSDPDLRSIPK